MALSLYYSKLRASMRTLSKFSFSPLGLLFVALLYSSLSPIALADYLTLFIFLTVLSQSGSLPQQTQIDKTTPAKPNIAISLTSSGIIVDIGADRHQEDWTTLLKNSCADAFRTRVRSTYSNFKIHFIVHADFSLDALEVLRDALSVLASYDCTRSPGRSKGTAPLELVVDMRHLKSSLSAEALAGIDLNVDGLGSVRKLTWMGPFADLLFTQPKPRTPWGTLNTFGRVSELLLLNCELDPQSLLEILSACPAISSCEVQRLVPSTNDAATPTGSCDDVVHLPQLKHLKISSTVGLRAFFKSIKFNNLKTLSLQLSRSATAGTQQCDIPWTPIPWLTLSKFELRAPLDYPSILALKLFFSFEPAHFGRDHVLIGEY